MPPLYEEDDHVLASRHVRPSVVFSVIVTALTLLEYWVWTSLNDHVVRVALTAGIVCSSASALLAGNTYRLKDWRNREGRRARSAQTAKALLLARLPSKATITHRYRLAMAGGGVGVLSLVVTLVFARHDVDSHRAIVACIISLAFAICCYIAGTFLSPID